MLLIWLCYPILVLPVTLTTGQGWQRYRKQLSQIAVDGQPLALLEHDFLLSRTQAERSLVYLGHAARLRRLLSSSTGPFHVAIVAASGASCGAGKPGFWIPVGIVGFKTHSLFSTSPLLCRVLRGRSMAQPCERNPTNNVSTT